MRLCWADKIGVVWAMIVFGVGFAMVDSTGSHHMIFSPTGQTAFWTILQIVVLPPWVFLRVIDLLLGGPRRRRGAPRVVVMPPGY